MYGMMEAKELKKKQAAERFASEGRKSIGAIVESLGLPQNVGTKLESCMITSLSALLGLRREDLDSPELGLGLGEKSRLWFYAESMRKTAALGDD